MSWTTHRIIGAEGVRLTVLAAGPADGRPILFLHGFAQSALSWKPTIAGPMAEEFRLLALDLRGHGGSDRPEHAYADGGVWAEDVAATIGQMGLNRPVLVGWSYGGTVIGDYLARYGGDRLSGIALVGACPKMGPSARPFIGPAGRTHFPALLGDDFAAAVETARAFVRAMATGPLPTDAVETALAAMMSVPLPVRRAIMRRELDHDAVLASYTGPALVIHGTGDQVILPTLGEHIARILPSAELVLYDGVGHLPFLEDQNRFQGDLTRFVRSIR